MAKTRRERCPHCGFLEVIKWVSNAVTKDINAKNVVVNLPFVVKI